MKPQDLPGAIEDAKAKIIRTREQDWWVKNRIKYLKTHPELCHEWLQSHDSIRDMPVPDGAAPDQTPPKGFVAITASSGRGYIVIAADAFEKMTKSKRKKLLDYANL